MERDPLERFAEAIGDGRPLDEAEAEAASGEVGGDVVRNLMALSQIRQVHRVPDAASVTGEPGARWGGYRLLEKLGGGAFGEVWRAWDEALHRQVALKLLKDDDGGRLLEEGRLLARADHPGVARVLAVETHDGRPGLALELVDGLTLEERVEAEGALPAAEVSRIGAEVAEALAAAHAVGVAHGDVKAQNVVLAPAGRAVLVDFGSGARRGETPGGRVTGTPAYLAPERRDGGPPSPAGDVWALGVLLSFLQLGRLPDPATDSAAGLPAPARATFAPDPAARPSASALAAALRPTTGPPASARARRRPPLVAVATALVVLASAVVALVRTSPPAPLEVDARLLRGAGPFEAIASGTAVSAGDLLQLELTLGQQAHVYVLNHDDRGSRALLFPLPGYEAQNPLPAGTITLPGPRADSETRVAWTLGEAGAETFLVLVTREPLADLEREISKLPPPEGSTGALAHPLGDRELAATYRGVTGFVEVAPSPAPGPAPGEGGDRVFQLAREAASPRNVRVLEFVLPHAPRN